MAIERAERALNPDATSNDEDAWMLAELIHSLGLQVKQIRFETRANGRAMDDRFERQIRQREGETLTGYSPDEEGNAKTPDGSACLTIAQQIARLEERERDLWEATEEEGVGRKAVEEKLVEVKKLSLERMKQAALKP